MASGNQQLGFAIRAINEASKVLKDVQKDLDDVDKHSSAADRALGGVGKALGALGSPAKAAAGALGDMAKIAGGFVLGQGILQAPGFLMDAAKAAAEDEAATARLVNTFQNYANMAGAAPDTFQRLNDLLDQRILKGQELAFTDDAVRDSFSTLLAATDDSTEAVTRQQAAFDLSRGAGISLEAATRMLSKITDENTDAFKRLGIELPKTATEADALAAVQARFGGAAEAYAQSTAGQFEQTKIRMGELKEQIGTALLPVMTKIGEVLITEVVPKLEQFAGFWAASVQPKVEAFIAWLGPQLTRAGQYFETEIKPKVQSFVDTAVPLLQRLADEVQTQFAKFQQYYQSDLRPAIDNVKTAIAEVVDWIRQHWGQIEGIVRPVFEQVANIVETNVKVVREVLQIVIDLLGGDFSGAWNNTKELVGAVVGFWKDTVSNGLEFIRGLGSVMLDIGGWLFDQLKAGASEAWSRMWSWLQGVPGDIKSTFTNIDWLEIGKDILRGIGDGIEAMRGWIIDKVTGIAGEIAGKLNPKNWVGSPMGIQNWYPYYLEMGLQNMADVALKSPYPGIAAAAVAAPLAASLSVVGSGGAVKTAGDYTTTMGVAPGYTGPAEVITDIVSLIKDVSRGKVTAAGLSPDLRAIVEDQYRATGGPPAGFYGTGPGSSPAAEPLTVPTYTGASGTPYVVGPGGAMVRAGAMPGVTVVVEGSVYGVDDLMYQLDRAAKRAGLAGFTGAA